MRPLAPLLAVLLPAAALAAELPPGKLDVDLRVDRPRPPAPERRPAPLEWKGDWTPGDPRDQAAAGPAVRTLSHAGYAGLGVAGLVASVATGGVAPAVGFGLVALVQLHALWAERRARRKETA